jgi:hypothetical protein
MAAPPPAPTPQAQGALGATVIVMRRTLTYTVVACAVAAGILSVAPAIYLYGEVLIAGVVTITVLSGLFFYVRAQRNAWLVLHEHGLRLVTPKGQDVLLWADITELKPLFSYAPSPNTIIELVVTRRSQGRMVIRNNWQPRSAFREFIAQILTSGHGTDAA